MTMPMLEHESNTSIDGIASRASTSLQSISTTLDRTFLIKKMEVSVLLDPGLESAASPGAFAVQIGKVVFFHSTGVESTIATAYDETLMNQESHNDIIWEIPFVFQPITFDSTSETYGDGQGVAMTRTKSFPKGYPLDKSDTYTWNAFNPSSTTYHDPSSRNSELNLRVRYWGVYL